MQSVIDLVDTQVLLTNGLLTRYVKLRVAHAPGMPGTFYPPPTSKKPLVSDPGIHHDTCVTHVGIANLRWRGKRSRHFRRMRNPQFYVSVKRSMHDSLNWVMIALDNSLPIISTSADLTCRWHHWIKFNKNLDTFHMFLFQKIFLISSCLVKVLSTTIRSDKYTVLKIRTICHARDL